MGLSVAFLFWVLCICPPDGAEAHQNCFSMGFHWNCGGRSSRLTENLSSFRSIVPSPAPSIPKSDLSSAFLKERIVAEDASTESPRSASPGRNGLSGVKIAGIVFASIAGILQIVVITFLIVKRRQMLALGRSFDP